jgi:ATP-dependent Clp protease ATP-binding subunit ClpX
MFDVPSQEDVARVVVDENVVMSRINPTLVPRPVEDEEPQERSA